MISSMAPEFTYRFYGEHALSGERHTRAALRRWWLRVFRIFPDPTFEVREVIVSGWPWSTRVATSVIVRAPLPDGSRYENVIHQFLHMRWARITKIRTLEDTVTLQRALDVVAASGNEEAHAPPITDDGYELTGWHGHGTVAAHPAYCLRGRIIRRIFPRKCQSDQLRPGADPELAEHLAEVMVDRAGADK
jgi:ketosteroid isomerase-like protein